MTAYFQLLLLTDWRGFEDVLNSKETQLLVITCRTLQQPDGRRFGRSDYVRMVFNAVVQYSQNLSQGVVPRRRDHQAPKYGHQLQQLNAIGGALFERTKQICLIRF
uniref:Uncharacterized protein n=1 Tax=Romanomermis culicivorax TaxID=13658 RepID=A0A915JST0_ROMCU